MDRHRKQLEEDFKPETKLQGEDVQQLLVVKEELKRHKCLGEFAQRGRRRISFNGANCEGPEAATPSTPVANKTTELASEADDSDDIGFWKETRQHQSGFTYQRSKKVPASDGCNAGGAGDEVKTEAGTDESVDYCKPTGQPQSRLELLKTEHVSVSDTGRDTYTKPFSISEYRERCEDGCTLLTHKNKKGFATGGCSTGHASVHAPVHAKEKTPGCVVWEKSITLKSQIISHQCVGEISQLHTANKLFSSSQAQVPTRFHTALIHSSRTGEEHFTERGSLSQDIVVHTGVHVGVKQEDPEPPHIKEEQEELRVSQEGEQLQGREEEADIAKFPFTPVPVKSEHEDFAANGDQ
ncbi:hypothetical protein PFLUV_G00276360 [Perca fluviatilis]|uniref:Uncharacterized protein n=1 Tax=Perca fluviatilis TaxID=8168 RepID=A0A6A5DMA9_PERFL|nr:hypothetical protein PFLUV_G00276360 [Perca fluviatilis]